GGGQVQLTGPARALMAVRPTDLSRQTFEGKLSMDYQAVLDEVKGWPVDDRIRLVREVCDQIIDLGSDPELSAELKAELDRRIEELDRNPDAGIPWDAVKARVLG